jgi:uncharacterized protein YkwD
MFKSLPTLLFLIIILNFLFPLYSCVKKNGYIKLVKYDVNYGVQMAEKNQDKYFTSDLKIKNMELNDDLLKQLQMGKNAGFKMQVNNDTRSQMKNKPKMGFSTISSDTKPKMGFSTFTSDTKPKMGFSTVSSGSSHPKMGFGQKKDPKKEIKFDFNKQANHTLQNFHDNRKFINDDELVNTLFNKNAASMAQNNRKSDKKKKKDQGLEDKKDPASKNIVKSFLKKMQTKFANMKSKPKDKNVKTKDDLKNQDPWELRVSKESFKLLNKFRKSNSLKKLEWDDSVYKVSKNHSLAMASKKKISHDGFDARTDKLGKEFFVYKSAENVGYFMNPNEVSELEVAQKLLTGWINSSGHRRNMLLPDISHGAVSVVRLLRGGAYYYGTQFFIRK